MSATPERERTANRIRANRHLLDALEALWAEVPEWRFGQLVKNLSRDETGFADIWEWKHGAWLDRIQTMYESVRHD